jgi:hypothetical protein
MAGLSLTPCRTMAAEDIRDLQSRARHARVSAGWPDLLELERDVLQRAHDLADRLGGDAGIERRGVELGVTEQELHRSQIACAPVNQSCLGPTQRVRSKHLWVEPNACHPIRQKPSILTGCHRLARSATSGEKVPTWLLASGPQDIRTY